MPTFSLAYLRTHLNEALTQVDAEEIVIARDCGDNLMLIKEADWRALQETVHLLSTPLNAERLQQSLQQVRAECLVEIKQA